MRDLTFYKMTGAVNDFILVDLTDSARQDIFYKQVPEADLPAFAKWVCDRRFGVGADGFVALMPSTDDSLLFEWSFYNSDGSSAEMCGNAARCAARLAIHLRLSHPPFEFLTIAGRIKALNAIENRVAVQTTPINSYRPGDPLTLDNAEIQFDFVNSGIPHAVLFVDPAQWGSLNKELSSAIRWHDQFQPAGTNVTYTAIDGPDKIRSTTFERGVEDFTLACGTGAVAAAYAYHKRQPGSGKVQVQLPGGRLEIDFTKDSPVMTGPADLVGEFKLMQKDSPWRQK